VKKNWKKWILGFIILIVVLFLSVVAYFYVALSGNPFVMWQQQRAVVKVYENRYHEPFDVIGSNYDYKRGEYEIELSPKSNPEYEFRTTLYEASQIDLYGKMRSIAYLRELIVGAIGSDYADEKYTFNVSEDYRSPGVLETDMMKRLSQNMYTVSFSFDVPSIDTDEMDAMFMEIHDKIFKAIDVPIEEMTLRFSAYDGTNYHHFETTLADF
jgi:hypothetical protein